MYDPCVNPSGLVIGAGTMLYEGVVTFITLNISAMFPKPGLVGSACFTIVDARAATTRYLVNIRGRESVWWASNCNKIPYLHTTGGYDGHLVANQPLNLI